MDKSLILNKLKSYLNYKKDKDFADFLGISVQTYSNWKARNMFDIDLIYKKCEFLNTDWLLTGKGPMVKENPNHLNFVNEPQEVYLSDNNIPLVNVTAIGGFGNSNFSIEHKDVKDYYVIPKFQHKHVDFMIEVEGSSMYPKYNSGDVVACRVINEKKFIQWNKTHVVATKDQGLIIKRINKGNDSSLTMVSDNKDYAPFEVPYEEIDGIALVVGVIRLE